MVLLLSDDEDFSMETRDASPAHLLIKIESFSLLSVNGIREYESREFVAGDLKWKLTIFPDGDESGKKDDDISVNLSIAGTSSLPVDWEVNAMFNIFLFNQIQDNYLCFRGKLCRFHAMNPKWGFSKLISKKCLMDPANGYIVDDNCVFGAEVFVVKSQRLIDWVSIQKVTHPYKHVLVISHFSKLESVWNSEELVAGDYRWKLVVYPKGNGSGKGRSVSIFATCVDSASFAPHEKVKADIYICLKNKINDQHCTGTVSSWFSLSIPTLGHPDFVPIGDLCDPAKGFIIDDCCFLETEISLKAVVRDAPK